MTQVAAQASRATTVAAIDIGANAIRMVVADVAADGLVAVLERTQREVRLGQDTFVTGRLGRQTLSAAIAILSDYRRVLETYKVKQIRAVATSAVREAENADAFLDRVYLSCNLDVEVIDPSEESRLTVSAVRASLPDMTIDEEHPALIADVGGGSALLTVLEHGEIAASESYRLGSVRLQEVLSTTEEKPQRAAELIRHQIAGILTAVVNSLPMDRVRTFIAVGGDARFAARQAGKPTQSADLHMVSRRAFDRLVAKCTTQSAEELAAAYDLPHADAQTLSPALLVYQSLLHATKAQQVLVSHVSMRDGLLLDLARGVTGGQDEELARSILHSARTVGEKYRYDAEHGAHVSELAVRLFDELQTDHGLTQRHRLLLRVAGLLHEVGGFVSTASHHKHSYYLLANAQVFGLRREEMEVVAQVARYHRRSMPKKSHLEYMALPREQRIVVSKLAALLRVADCLDRSHSQHVRDMTLERRENELVIRVAGANDLGVEQRALDSKADLFEDVYGMSVRLETT